MSTAPVFIRSRRQLHHLFDAALFVCGAAAATALVTKGIHDARPADAWPRWLELVYVVAVVLAVPALLAAGWAKLRLNRLGAVIDDERTAENHWRSTGAALAGVLLVQVPFFLRVEVSSLAQAQFTVAAGLLVYGAAWLWHNREAR